MKRIVLAVAISVAISGAVLAAARIPTYIAMAVADAGRPQADKDRDPLRMPAQVMAFAGVRPGQTVIELVPAKGYFTRILSKIVGANGHVYEALPQFQGPDVKPTSNGLAADPQYANVSEILLKLDAMKAAGPVDLIWTSQNYHDMHLARLKLDVAALDKALFESLKPGGVLFVEDHAAEPKSGLRDVDKMHRIDEAVVIKELEAAGFKLDGESNILRSGADTHVLSVFDPAIRGRTDQFLLRFRKPRR